MKDRPILFSGPMVPAILAGTKTQTRRVMKPQPRRGRYGATHPTNPGGLIENVEHALGGAYHIWEGPSATACLTTSGVYVALRQSPYGEIGDRLWVREVVALDVLDGDAACLLYRATDPRMGEQPVHEVKVPPSGLDWAKRQKAKQSKHKVPVWCPSIHMPRWASRVTLEVTSVRVERLQDISEEDAEAEGVDSVAMSDVPRQGTLSYRDDFAQLWQLINGKRPGCSWADSPWVWVVGFRRVE